jgi:3-phosphoshikimate 1-carboxyvinyltransferase
MAHRLLICAAFADAPTTVICTETNNDIEATAGCLSSLGANIKRTTDGYEVEPIDRARIQDAPLLDCGESGSTLRFMLPIVAALGKGGRFALHSRLPERPLSPLREELEAHGITLEGKEILTLSGRLEGNSFSIDGGVSSQFVSGLLFALSLLDHPSTLEITGKLESAPYVDMTCNSLALFGAKPNKTESGFEVNVCGKLVSPILISVEGDWSNAAFPLALGVLSGEVEVLGLDRNSTQGDSKIVELLREFGADITYIPDRRSYVAKKSELHGIRIDASQIPDLVPILATVASVANGRTEIYGAARLRLKESDRLESTSQMLNALGASITVRDDGLIINGRNSLSGGCVDSFNDHRIAMSAAVASAVSQNEVTVKHAESVQKSYPRFWDDMMSLGIKATIINT